MTALTNSVMALSVAALVSLGQWLGEGMTAFEKKDYKTAIDRFTKVIESKEKYNPSKDTALYMRAKSFVMLKDKKAAAKDLETLLKSNPDRELAKLAAADYQTVSGKKWEGDRSSPEATWRTFLAAIEKQDIDAVRRCCSGKLLLELGEALNQPDFFREVQGEIGPLLSVTYNKDKTRALIVFQEGARLNRTEELIMTNNDGIWTLSDEYSRHRNEAEFNDPENMSAEMKVSSDMNRVRMLDAACHQYMLESEKRPDRLPEVARYVRNFEMNRVSSVNGKPFVMAFGANGRPCIFMSSAVGGKRVAIVNRIVKNFDEKEFQRLAKEHGIKMPQHWRETKVSKEETAKIQKLIQQLGARSFQDRKAAYGELQKLGAKAGRELEKAAKDPDPEVAATARKLLSEM